MNVDTLCRFQLESDTALSAVRQEMQDRVIQALFRNLDGPTKFLNALKRYNGVVSGEFVISLLDSAGAERYTHLDVFIDKRRFWEFIMYLVQEEKAQAHDVLVDIPGLRREAYITAMDFKIKSRQSTIRVIQSTGHSPLFSIPQYCSTHFMNVLTHDRLVIAYPKLTFLRTGILMDDTYPTNDILGTFRVVHTDSVMNAPAASSGPFAQAISSGLRCFDDAACASIVFAQAGSGDYLGAAGVRWRLRD